MENVQFEYQRAEIQPRCGEKIARLAAWLNGDQQVAIALDSHVDDPQANDFVPDLGLRRAQAVRAALIKVGVAADRITIGVFGTRRPLCGELTEACLAMNRRVEILATRISDQ